MVKVGCTSDVLFPVTLVLENRNAYLVGAIWLKDVDMEVRDRTSVVAHISFASVKESAGIAKVFFGKFSGRTK